MRVLEHVNFIESMTNDQINLISQDKINIIYSLAISRRLVTHKDGGGGYTAAQFCNRCNRIINVVGMKTVKLFDSYFL